MMLAKRTLLLLGAVVAFGCERAPPNATPDGAVRDFVERMRYFDGSSDQAEALFLLLSERARANLQTRAERYGDASGKKIAPSAMLVPRRVTWRFTPQTYTAQTVGKYALVEIAGVLPDERAQVPCVLEDGAWRLDLVLPELPPLLKRPSHEP